MIRRDCAAYARLLCTHESNQAHSAAHVTETEFHPTCFLMNHPDKSLYHDEAKKTKRNTDDDHHHFLRAVGFNGTLWRAARSRHDVLSL